MQQHYSPQMHAALQQRREILRQTLRDTLFKLRHTLPAHTHAQRYEALSDVLHLSNIARRLKATPSLHPRTLCVQLRDKTTSEDAKADPLQTAHAPFNNDGLTEQPQQQTALDSSGEQATVESHVRVRSAPYRVTFQRRTFYNSTAIDERRVPNASWPGVSDTITQVTAPTIAYGYASYRVDFHGTPQIPADDTFVQKRPLFNFFQADAETLQIVRLRDNVFEIGSDGRIRRQTSLDGVHSHQSS